MVFPVDILERFAQLEMQEFYCDECSSKEKMITRYLPCVICFLGSDIECLCWTCHAKKTVNCRCYRCTECGLYFNQCQCPSPPIVNDDNVFLGVD